MEGSERDNTQDWLLPEGAAPPLLGELELRIDEALAIARASEAAVGVVGEAAIDAAKQARRAAELAERASEAALGASRAAVARQPVGTSQPSTASPSGVIFGPAPLAPLPEVASSAPASSPLGDASLRRFSERADRVVARLRALERLPRAGTSSAAAGHRRPGG
jgi:hypothetical protein